MAQNNQQTTFQTLILQLQQYWADLGCMIVQPYDMEMGAGTFHPATFLRAIGPEPWQAAYVQPSRRPTDGRYGDNANRLQRYYQFQVLLKPSPDDIQQCYLNSLNAIGIDPHANDIRFVEDNWESPTLGAWGLGWEVWLNGMEISQFTYFQQIGGLNCSPVSGEITYGLERIAMCLQDCSSVYDLVWSQDKDKIIRYGDLYHQNEVEMSRANFELNNIEWLLNSFDSYEQSAQDFIQQELSLPAYEMTMKASHVFNLICARGAISVTERQRYILRLRTMSHAVAVRYYESRERLGFPLLKQAEQDQ